MATKPRSGDADPQAELRRRYKSACRAYDVAMAQARRVHGAWPPNMNFEPFADLRCGAIGKRTGLPCPHTSLYPNGRCRWHGGLSTGPKTETGKSKSSNNFVYRWGDAPSLDAVAAAGDQDQSRAGLVPRRRTDEALAVPAPTMARSACEPHETHTNVGLEGRASTRHADLSGQASVPRLSPLSRICDFAKSRNGRRTTVGSIAAATHLTPKAVESALRVLVAMRRLDVAADPERRTGSPATMLRIRLRSDRG